jgi:cytochrome P450
MAELQSVFPAERTAAFDPPEEYHCLAAQRTPVSLVRLWNEERIWLVTGYQETRRVLKEQDLFSADMNWPKFPLISRQKLELQLKDTFVRQDGDQHARVRRVLAKEFTINRMQAMRPVVEQIVETYFKRMEESARPVDFVEAFALPVPSQVMCHVLGIPFEDGEYFTDRAKVALSYGSEPDEVLAAMGELQNYLLRLVEEKRNNLGDDVISRLIEEQESTGRFKPEEVVMISLLLRGAGHETTANMIGLAVLALLRDPAQRKLLADDPGLAPQAVEELLRYLSIMHHGLARVVTEDMELGGQQLRKGDGLVAMINVANRDQEKFPNPDTLDLANKDASTGHLAFGFGAHQCLGQALARLELEVIFERILQRFPDLRLAVPDEDIRLRTDMFVYGVHQLPVEW